MNRLSNGTIENSWRPNCRSRKIGERYVAIADHGAWAILDEKDHSDLESGNLSSGLHKLLEQKGLIITKSNEGLIKKRYQLWTLPYFIGPTLHIIVTTKRCNLRCVYCHASSTPESTKNNDLSLEIARKVVDFIMQTPSRRITIEFQGGESLLNFDAVEYIVELVESVAQIHKKSISFTLVSNFTLLNEEIVEFTLRHKIGLATSLDGPLEIHDLNRRNANGKGTFKLVESNIALATKKGHKVGLLTVLTKNTCTGFRKIIDFYVQIGMESLCINPVLKLGRARNNWSSLGIDTAEFLKIYKNILDYTLAYFKKGTVILDRMFLVALAKLTNNMDVTFMDFRSPCGAVCGQLVYDFNGDIYPCDEARSFPELVLGNVATHSYKEIVNARRSSEIIEASFHNQRACTECAYRPYCGLCPIISYAERGSLVPDLTQDSRCQFSKFIFDYIFAQFINDEQTIMSIARYQRIRNTYLSSLPSEHVHKTRNENQME